MYGTIDRRVWNCSSDAAPGQWSSGSVWAPAHIIGGGVRDEGSNKRIWKYRGYSSGGVFIVYRIGTVVFPAGRFDGSNGGTVGKRRLLA